MSGRWKIETEPENKLICWHLCGFFDVSDVKAFHQDTLSVLNGLAASGQHIGFSDLRKLVIQSQDAVTSFEHVLNDPRIIPRRHAVVTPLSLVRGQFLRVSPDSDVKVFDNPADARAWLLPKR